MLEFPQLSIKAQIFPTQHNKVLVICSLYINMMAPKIYLAVEI